MTNSKFFPLQEASCLAQSANLMAARVRTNRKRHQEISGQIQHWEQVFSLSIALFATFMFFLLAVADSFILGDMYRQLSQMFCDDPDQLRWTIALMVNTIAALCSHELTQVFRNGPFFDWEVRLYDTHTPAEIAIDRVFNARMSRRYGLFAKLLIFSALLTLVLYMRIKLMSDAGSHNPINNWLIVIGLCLMGFEIIAGYYFLYLLEYLIWVIFQALLNRRIKEGILNVSKADRSIQALCSFVPSGTPLTTDINDALHRFYWHRLDFTYCDLPERQNDGQTPILSLPQIPSQPSSN